MFLAVEPFLLQDNCRHAIVEQRQAGIMGSGYDPENAHGDTLVIDGVFNSSGAVPTLKFARSRNGTLVDWKVTGVKANMPS